MIEPTKAQFDEWRQSDVGRWFFGQLEAAVPAIRERWAVESFDGEMPDPMRLARLKAKAEAFLEISASEYRNLVSDQALEEQGLLDEE